MHFKIAMWCMYTEKISSAASFNSVLLFFFNRQTDDNSPEQKDFASGTVSQRPRSFTKYGSPSAMYVLNVHSGDAKLRRTDRQTVSKMTRTGTGAGGRFSQARTIVIRGLSPWFSVLCLFHVKIFNLFTYLFWNVACSDICKTINLWFWRIF